MATDTNITTTSAKGGMGSPLSLAWSRMLSVLPGDRGTSARTRLRIRRALGDEGAGIRPTAVGGFVELRGTVSSKEAYERAAEVARGTAGARGVLNFLDVR